MKRNGFKQALFTPLNREKYKGSKIPFYRSSYEYKLMNYLDKHPSVIGWASEPFAITYFNPNKGKVSRYYPDFIVSYKGRDGNVHMEMIEIKPYRQTLPPKASKGKKNSTLLIEAKLWMMNVAKWEAAKKYCAERNMVFRIMTEKDLSILN
jgi:hypothetical protein